MGCALRGIGMENKKNYSEIPFYLGLFIFVIFDVIRYGLGIRFFITMFGILCGIAIAIYGLINFCINHNILPRVARIIRRMIHVILMLGAISFVIIEIIILSGGDTNVTYTEDYVLILGAGLDGDAPSLTMQSRIDAAVEYLNKNQNAYAIACGGMGTGETITEAEAIRRGLLRSGIHEDRIILEGESTNTNQNIMNAARMMREHEGVALPRVAVITNEFHLWRGKFIARRNGMEPTGFAAETPLWWLKGQYYVREYFSVIKALCGY